MADDYEKDDLEAFLSKIDKVNSLVMGLKNDDEKAKEEADKFLNEHDRKKRKEFDRSIINRDKSPPRNPLPEGVSPDQAAFLRSIQDDAAERAARRKDMEKESNVFKDKGNVFFQKGDYVRACDMYTDGLKIDNTNLLLYLNRAQARLKLGYFQLAREDCDLALYFDEKSVKAHVRLGLALTGLNLFAEAVETFTKALVLAPLDKKSIDAYIEETRRAEATFLLDQEVKQALKSHPELSDTILHAMEDLRKPGFSPSAYKDVIDNDLLPLVMSSDPATQPLIMNLLRGNKFMAILSQNEALLELVARIEAMAMTHAKGIPSEPFNPIDMDFVECAISLLELLRYCCNENETMVQAFISSKASIKVLQGLLKTDQPILLYPSLLFLRCCSQFAAARQAFLDGEIHVELENKLLSPPCGFSALSKANVGIGLSFFALEPRYREIVAKDFSRLHFPHILALASDPDSEKAAFTLLINLSQEASLRAILAQNTTMRALVGLFLSEGKPMNSGTQLYAFEFFSNLCLEHSAVSFFGENGYVPVFVAMLMNPATNVETRASLLQLISRLLINVEIATLFMTRGGPLALKAILHQKDPSLSSPDHVALLEPFLRCVLKCVQLAEQFKEIFINKEDLLRFAELLNTSQEKVFGNVALCIAEFCKSEKAAKFLEACPILVSVLLDEAKKESSPAAKNSSIALARLASHPNLTHVNKLRELRGFEVLQARNHP